ncbi:MAG: thiamine phosphate synthase [Planctomycetota bacterium]|nr:MAG: thiamine phosphate synthase [Planctomycetota bacterium]
MLLLVAKPLPSVLVITPEQHLPGEQQALEGLLAAGARIHLRKPGLEAAALSHFLAALPDEARRGITLHGPRDVAEDLGCGGWHHPQASAGNELRGSRSWHRLSEPCAGVDYGLLSPIWPSTSKPGYGPMWTVEQLRHAAQTWPVPVYALGGVTPAHCTRARALGFAGVAVLGWLWQAGAATTLDRWHELRCAWDSAAP